MSSLFGCDNKIKYARYSSKDPLINITASYPSSWNYSEQRGSKDSFAQVIFYELGRKDREFAANMIITVEEADKLNVASPTLENITENIITKAASAKLLSKTRINLWGYEGYDVTLTYTTLDNLLKANAKTVEAKTRIVIVKKGGKFYTMRYKNTTDEFDKMDKAFYRCIKSIKFKD